MKNVHTSYWRLLKEAYEVEVEFNKLRDMRYLTNDLAARQRAARDALALYFKERAKA